jgi:hypothetical protein
VSDNSEAAADYAATLDIAFARRPAANWHRYSKEQRDEWWVMENAASGIDVATRSLDRPVR